MHEYIVWVQHEDEWKVFGKYGSVSGKDAIKQAREEKTKLQMLFGRENILDVNLDYESADSYETK